MSGSLARRTFNRLLAFATLGIAGCGPREQRPSVPAAAGGSSPSAGGPSSAPTTGSTARRFLALGDSYTIGESVPPEQRWPVQLVARLREAGVNVADPQIIAHTGWRTDDLARAITRENPQGPFDLVALLIGVNNQYQGLTADQYRAEYPPLLKRAIAFAGGEASRVIVLSIPDWGATPFGGHTLSGPVTKQIDAFNAVNRAESEKAGVAYVDITPTSRRAIKEADLVADDGLHPSGKMYAEWVKLALPAARAALAHR